jgi:hypothetical protein
MEVFFRNYFDWPVIAKKWWSVSDEGFLMRAVIVMPSAHLMVEQRKP